MDISNNNDDDNKPSTYALNGKIMLCSVIILFIVVFVVACFHSYVRLCFYRDHPRRRRRRRRLFSDSIYPTETSVSSKGLEISILKAMPTFTYNASDNDHRLDCAVCLSEFEGGEHGRVLPNCKHVFHIDCIDPWFRSHSNCPLCRSPVQPVILTPTTQFRDEVVITVSEPAGWERLEDEKGSSRYSPSTSFSTEECGREPLDLVGMSMEDRLSNLRNSGKSSDGSKCSGNQVLSMKRIWSI